MHRLFLLLSLAITALTAISPHLVAEEMPLHGSTGVEAASLPAESVEALTPEESAEKKRQVVEAMLFGRLTVVGGEEAVREVPGSAEYISLKQLQEQDYADVHRILRQIPGVTVQDEEGYGLRPNIGMRGTGIERSQKITLLEDGILIAPAPYSAPAAYYFPTVGRMESIEVRKGSSSIRQGPLTTGGVLNFVSTSIPSQLGASLNLAAGEDSTVRAHASVGDSRERFGWLLEGYHLQSDGFKQLDGGGDTGFELFDFVGKIRIHSASTSSIQQALELKIGKTTQQGDETYLGLTADDFSSTPFRRYAASETDKIDTDHEQIQVRHFLQISPAIDLTTTVYRNDFFRNWHKLDSVGGVAIARVLEDPMIFGTELALLRGERDDVTGTLRVRNNRREYYSQGVQAVAAMQWPLGSLRQNVELGVRFHQDEEDRFQEDDRFGIQSGRMYLVGSDAPGSNANRIGEAKAVAVFVQNQMVLGRWSVTPGLRFESIAFRQQDFGRSDPTRGGATLIVREHDLSVLIPGLGVNFEVTPRLGLFAGAHKGFAPPGPGSDERTKPEQSVNLEAGFRYDASPSRLQIVGFFNDYDNLLGRDSASSGGAGSGDLFNGGRVEVKGLEASFETDPGRLRSMTRSYPLRVAYTYTSAVFQSSFDTSFEDWAPRVRSGDRLPYLPEQQWSASAAISDPRWSSHLTVTYSDATRTKSGSGPILHEQSTEASLVADVSFDILLRERWKIFTQIRNLTDDVYVAARRPAGLRPGSPRTLLAGMNWSF